MRILFLSNLYPNSQEPARATFNRQKIEALKKLCEVVVVAPVPYFPLKALFVKGIKIVPPEEEINGVEVYHPRAYYIPKLFRFMNGFLYYCSIRACIHEIYNKFSFDIVCASWAYPDGFTGMKIAKGLNKPFVLFVHGSDINAQTKSLLLRKIITNILQSSDKVISVSKYLKKKMIKLGISDGKISVVYNGIDHNLFLPLNRNIARQQVGVAYTGKIVLFVGNLVEVKGVKFLIRAVGLSKRKDYKLFIVGEGKLRPSLEKAIKAAGLEDRVAMVGLCDHSKIPLWINAADLLCLPSLAEGLPNIILEAMACGIPVIASRVGGIPELIDNDSKLGVLFEPGDSREIAKSIDATLWKEWDHSYISSRAQSFSWEKNSVSLFEILKSCVHSNMK